MDICSSCAFKRAKHHDESLAECKHPAFDAGAGEVLGQMQEFIRTGFSGEFFIVRADQAAFACSTDTAWPLQFAPAVIAACEGFEPC